MNSKDFSEATVYGVLSLTENDTKRKAQISRSGRLNSCALIYGYDTTQHTADRKRLVERLGVNKLLPVETKPSL